MTVSPAQHLIQEYEFNTMLVHRLLDGLPQEESIIQLPFELNCLNWVLGHIIVNRSHGLEVLSVEHAWKDDVGRCITLARKISSRGAR